jgi:hypothetical protein
VPGSFNIYKKYTSRKDAKAQSKAQKIILYILLRLSLRLCAFA